MLTHFAESGDANIRCGSLRVHHAHARGDSTSSDPTTVDCADCRALLIADGDLDAPIDPAIVALEITRRADMLDLRFGPQAVELMERVIQQSDRDDDRAVLAELRRRQQVAA